MARKPKAAATAAAAADAPSALPAFEPEARYRITLKRSVFDGPMKFLPRDSHTVKGKVATRIADAIASAEKL